MIEVFNHLTGSSKQPSFTRLLVAPFTLRDELLRRIERETTLGERGRIIFQMDGFADEQFVDALYRASAAGVQVDLIVRSIWDTVAPVPGLSDRIRAVNFLGRFKEHSRVYYFGNEGDEEVFFEARTS